MNDLIVSYTMYFSYLFLTKAILFTTTLYTKMREFSRSHWSRAMVDESIDHKNDVATQHKSNFGKFEKLSPKLGKL